MISAVSNLGRGGFGVRCWWEGKGDGGGLRLSFGMLIGPFRLLHKRISLLSLLLFWRDSHLIFFQYSSHTPSFKAVSVSYETSSPILNFFNLFFLKNYPLGIPDTANKAFICCPFYVLRILFAFVIYVFHLKSCVTVTSRYLMGSTFSRSVSS